MSGSEHASVDADDDRVAVTAGGVHVSKWLAETGSAVPIVKYEIRSVRDEDVRVALTDRIPEHLDLDDVGFHDEYLGEHWQHTGAHAVRFEAELPAGETLSTVYGVRRDAIDDPATFLGRPELSISASANDAGDEAAAESTADAPAVEREHDGDEDHEAVGDEPSTLSLADPTAEDDHGGDDDSTAPGDSAGADDGSGDAALDADAADEDDGPGAGDDDAEAPSILAPASNDVDDGGDEEGSPGGDRGGDDVEGVDADADELDDAAVVERFVAALQSDAVDAETRAALGRELNVQLSASTSQFVEHLQSRAKEKRGQLEADLESLEDSVAELYGTKADSSTVASLAEAKAYVDDVDALAADVAALGEEKAAVDDVERVRESLDALEDAAATEDALAEAEDAFEADLEAVRADLDALEERAATADALEALADEVAALDEATPTREAFESLRADHDDLASTVDDVETALDEETDALAADVEETADALRSEVDDLEHLLSERMERERGEVDDALASKADESALAATDDRVDALESAKADADRVATVESTLEAEYVTEADITDAIEARMQRSLLSRTLLVAGGAAAGGGTALAANGVAAGGALVVAGVVAFAAWYWLERRELAPEATAAPGALAHDASVDDDPEALADDAGDDESTPPELAAADAESDD